MSAVGESQALKRWCPFSRVATQMADGSIVPSSANRLHAPKGYGPISGSMCIGSGCMAWRVRVHHENRDCREPEDERIGKYSSDGYCGLAGRPE